MSDYFDDTMDSPPSAESDIPSFTFGGDGRPRAEGAVSDFEALVRLARESGRDPTEKAKKARAIGEKIGSMGIDEKGASRAIYAWGQGKSRVEGPTINLILALAQEWGCMSLEVQVEELAKNRVKITVEIVDLVALNRTRRPSLWTLSPAPGKFAGDIAQTQRWETMQLNSAVSKAVRTAYESVLPDWYRQEALIGARNIQEAGILWRDGTDQSGRPKRYRITLAEATEELIERFSKIFNVGLDALEARLGVDVAHWTVTDLATLKALGAAINAGRITMAAAFPEEATEEAQAERAKRAKPAQKPQAAPRTRKSGLAGIPDRRGQTQTVDMDPGVEVEDEPAFDPDTGEVEMSDDEQAAIEAEERAAAQAELDMP